MTKNVGVRSEHRDGRDRVTKNVGARSEHCDSDQKHRRHRSRVRDKSEQCDKNLGAGRSRVKARLEQNMIHDNHDDNLQPVIRWNHLCHTFVT